MSDFIEEVEGQLRSERYRAMFVRALPWVIAAFVAVVVGWLAVWGWHLWRDRNIGRASVNYDKGITALTQGDETGAFSDLAPLAASGPAGYRTLALIQQGNIRLAANKTDEAVALYDQAAKAAPNAIFGDLARFKAVTALLDTAPLPQLQTRLAALIGENKPFTLMAREDLAMAKLKAGRVAEARGDLNALNLTLGVTPSMSQRIRTAMQVIDAGEAGTIAPVVQEAATLPPPRQPMVAAPSPADGSDQAAPAQGSPAEPDAAARTPQ